MVVSTEKHGCYHANSKVVSTKLVLLYGITIVHAYRIHSNYCTSNIYKGIVFEESKSSVEDQGALFGGVLHLEQMWWQLELMKFRHLFMVITYTSRYKHDLK